MRIRRALLKHFMIPSEVFHGIVCCYAQFNVPLSWELSVAACPELVSSQSLHRSEHCGTVSILCFCAKHAAMSSAKHKAFGETFRRKENAHR
jgi:hypothetical protein